MEIFDNVITQLIKYRLFSPLDVRLALFMLRLAKADPLSEGSLPESITPADLKDWTLFLSVALLSRWSSAGHVLIDLPRLAGKFLAECFPQENKNQLTQTFNTILNQTNPTLAPEDQQLFKRLFFCPELAVWQTYLQELPIVGTLVQPAELFRPLIIDTSSRLYLQRYWSHESTVSQKIKARLAQPFALENLPLTELKACLVRLFPIAMQNEQQPAASAVNEIDWQKVAVASTLLNRFCVISGGPGTGKTTTVAKILALFLEQHTLKTGVTSSNWMPQIYLTAPTGKAAARLAEAIQQAKLALNCSEQIKTALPNTGYTIHRFLYTLQMNKQGFLPDLIVIDEASMVDLSLMAKLLLALPDTTRIILLGDKDQLASVDAGAVLGDICAEAVEQENSLYFQKCIFELTDYTLHCSGNKEELVQEKETRLSSSLTMRDAIVLLTKNYRFAGESRLMAISQAIKNGNETQVMELLHSQRLDPTQFIEEDITYIRSKDKLVPKQPRTEPGVISWFEPTDFSLLSKMFRKFVREYFYEYVRAQDIHTLFSCFNRFRILCALRQGPWGVININQLIEYLLRRVGFIAKQEQWYLRRPIIITKNDYNLKLFNGDIGILWQETTGKGPDNVRNLRAYFPDPEKKDHFRTIPLQILPEHETVFAMTVHKSQGSEFDEVLLLLPLEDYPLITRELLYTAVTRTRKRLAIWGQEPVIRKGITRKLERLSGLKDKLWN